MIAHPDHHSSMNAMVLWLELDVYAPGYCDSPNYGHTKRRGLTTQEGLERPTVHANLSMLHCLDHTPVIGCTKPQVPFSVSSPMVDSSQTKGMRRMVMNLSGNVFITARMEPPNIHVIHLYSHLYMYESIHVDYNPSTQLI